MTGHYEVPLGSPTVASPKKSAGQIRKRSVAVPAHLSLPHTTPSHPSINPRLIYKDYAKDQQGPTTIGTRIRTFFLVLLLLCFPAAIFLIPMIQDSYYPRLVVALRLAAGQLDQWEESVIELAMDSKIDLLFLVLTVDSGDDVSGKLLPQSIQELANEKSGPSPSIEVIYTKDGYQSLLPFLICDVLDAEESLDTTSSKGDTLESDADLNERNETRVLVVNGESGVFGFSTMVSVFVQASIKRPNSVLATIGGNWRSHFRQVKKAEEGSSLDRFPNIVLHGTSNTATQVDLVDSLTSDGMIFRAGLFLPYKKELRKRMDEFVDSGPVDVLLEKEAEMILWNALLESFNITRTIIPSTAPASDKISTKESIFSQEHWITAAFELQSRWNIWKDYEFLNWSQLTGEQVEAIGCEGRHKQLCAADTSICFPDSVCTEELNYERSFLNLDSKSISEIEE